MYKAEKEEARLSSGYMPHPGLETIRRSRRGKEQRAAEDSSIPSIIRPKSQSALNELKSSLRRDSYRLGAKDHPNRRATILVEACPFERPSVSQTSYRPLAQM